MKKKYLNKISQILAIIGIVFTASISLSCSDADGITGSDSVLISGVAVDGYIYGARVYLDCDKDFSYDSDEVLAYTDKNGKFSFVSNADNAEKIQNCPVVVDATDTEYVFDSDHKEAGNWPSLKDVGREGFKISSPVGQYKVVSPLTMIAHTIDRSDATKIKDQLGITDDDLNTMGVQDITSLLYLDYFSTNDITDPAKINVLKKIAKVGRLLARILEVKQSPTNSDANTCIGQKCPELMKEALAYFDDLFSQSGVFNSEGVPIPDYHDLHEDIEDIENSGSKETFSTRFDGEKIDVDEFINTAIFQQNTGKPCTDDGNPSTDFEFMISFTSSISNNLQQISSYFPNAKMIYESYQNTSSSPTLNCANFFKNRGNKESKSAKAAAFVQFISTDIFAYMINKESSTLYQGSYDKAAGNNDVVLTRYYMKECDLSAFFCFPYEGRDYTITNATHTSANYDSLQKSKTIQFDINTMDITVITLTVDTKTKSEIASSTKQFIILDHGILEQVGNKLAQLLPSDSKGIPTDHSNIPDGSDGHQ